MNGWLQAMAVALVTVTGAGASDDPWVVYEGGKGPGSGKHVVLLAGDEEYRSEEALPMLGRILAVHHGFRCTVLFSVDPESGRIDPDDQVHVPGLAMLEDADLVVMFWRFRELPDEDMKHVVDYVESGRPLFGIRTATHAFRYSRNPDSPHAHYDFASKEWPGGFGRQVLGDTWISHHGAHGSQSTRGVIEPQNRDHPILRGVEDIWGSTDVYTIRHLLDSDRVLVRGQVLEGMDPGDPPLAGSKNDPMMPLIWVRERATPAGVQRVFCSTIGAATDLESEGLRRVFVNGCYWCVGLEDQIPAKSRVDPVGEYRPSPFGGGRFREGVRPSDHALPAR